MVITMASQSTNCIVYGAGVPGDWETGSLELCCYFAFSKHFFTTKTTSVNLTQFALKCFIFLFLLLCQVGKLNKQPPQQQQPRSYRWMVGQRSNQPSSQPFNEPTDQTIQLKPQLLCYSLFAGMEIFLDIKFTLEEPWTFWLCSTRERHTHEPRYMYTYLYTNTATDINVLCGYWNGEGFLWCMRLRWWYY